MWWSWGHQVGQVGFLSHEDYTNTNIGVNEHDKYKYMYLFRYCCEINKV